MSLRMMMKILIRVMQLMCEELVRAGSAAVDSKTVANKHRTTFQLEDNLAVI